MRRRDVLKAAVLAVIPRFQASASLWTDVIGHAGYGVPALDAQRGEALLVRRAPDQPPTLLRMGWTEGDGDQPFPSRDQSITLTTVSPEASDPIVPVRDGPFLQDPARRWLWREGATLHALDTSLRRQSITLPEAPLSLVRPALQRTGSPVYVFALAAGGRRVTRLSVPREFKQMPRIVEDVALPLAATRAAAAFAPNGRVAFAACAEQAPDSVLLLHDGTTLRQAQLRGTSVLSAPAIITVREEVRVAIIGRDAAGLSVVEATFPPGSGPATVKQRPLGPSRQLREAAVIYRSRQKAEPEAHAVLALERGGYLGLGSAGELAPIDPPIPPMAPLTLVPGARGVFALCCDRDRGPAMLQLG